LIEELINLEEIKWGKRKPTLNIWGGKSYFIEKKEKFLFYTLENFIHKK
jgi:hypothetical protein